MAAFSPPLCLPKGSQTNAPPYAIHIPGGTTCELQSRSQAESKARAAAAATLILQRAAKSYIAGTKRPSNSDLSGALFEIEKFQRRNKSISDVEKLYGQWRLIFVSDIRSKNPFLKSYYFPVRAHQTFLREEVGDEAPVGDVFDNGIFLNNGFASLHVRGPMRWVSERNRLEFSVDMCTVKVGNWEWKKEGLDKEGYSLEGRSVKTLPFFTFFLLRDDLAAARGRSGGVALYARVPESEVL